MWDALRRFPEIHVETSYEELDPLRPPELPSLMDFFMSLATDPEMRKKVSIYVLDRWARASSSTR